jgi:hypothetical protein
MIHKALKSLSGDEYAKFRLQTGFKFALIPLLSMAFAFFTNYILLRVSLSVLSSIKSDKDYLVEDLLYTFSSKGLLDIAPYSLAVFVGLIFLGMYTANMMIRPFRLIAEHCDNEVNGVQSSYDQDFITELKLLSSFSEWFFGAIEISQKAGVLNKIEIPKKYKKIHKPVFETSFFIQNFLIIIITTICTGLLIHFGALEIYEGVVALVTEAYPNQGSLNQFLYDLKNIYWVTANAAILLNVIAYFIFLFYLYSKVSTPAFGVFATMRSFISGKRSSRIHLIGYPYMRNYTRMINKYLDHVEKQFYSKDN